MTLQVTNDRETVRTNTAGAGDIAYLPVRILTDRYGNSLVAVELPSGRRTTVSYTDLLVED